MYSVCYINLDISLMQNYQAIINNVFKLHFRNFEGDKKITYIGHHKIFGKTPIYKAMADILLATNYYNKTTEGGRNNLFNIILNKILNAKEINFCKVCNGELEAMSTRRNKKPFIIYE